ncbi:MAG: ATP-binding protein, partial [Dehalococcoidia bacterium]
MTLRDAGEHRLKDLLQPEHLYQLVIDGLPAAFPPLRTLNNRPNNLPLQLTSLVGREREIGQLSTMLRQEGVRLVTLTGTGGSGKTRLGLQVAGTLLEDFSDGVFFINLAPLTDPALVLPTIAQSLGIKETGKRPLLESLKESLQEKQTLLLLDNFEQVLDAAPLLAELLVLCPRLKFL